MLLKLSEQLDLPLRERNQLFIAAGYAPVYPERPLTDPALEAARRAIDLVLAGHEPYPALAVDRHWTLVASNRAVQPLFTGVAQWLLQPSVNVLRLSLHPEGIAPRILNLPEWRSHLLERLQGQIDAAGDPVLVQLMQELRSYPVCGGPHDAVEMSEESDMVVPIRLTIGGEVFCFFSTTMVFGTPVDVTLSELAIESFFPADAITADRLREMASC
jgi:hypothetical protein